MITLSLSADKVERPPEAKCEKSLLDGTGHATALSKIIGVRNEHRPPRDAAHFGHRLLVVLYMMQDPERAYDIDAVFRKRQSPRVAGYDLGIFQPFLLSYRSQFWNWFYALKGDLKPFLLKKLQPPPSPAANFKKTIELLEPDKLSKPSTRKKMLIIRSMHVIESGS